jgi:hypothetical protein
VVAVAGDFALDGNDLGVVFLASSLLASRPSTGEAHVFAPRNVLICMMLLLTLISQSA